MSMFLGEAQVSVGSQGADVKRLQEILSGGGYNVGPIDGIFGTQTQAAVKAFQLTKGLLADGVVGPQTWAALFAPPVTPTPSEVIPVPAPSFFNNTTVMLIGAALLGVALIARKR
jgi:peptidoglycan hydrolase-like protein with peptidoglycan-binding domain